LKKDKDKDKDKDDEDDEDDEDDSDGAITDLLPGLEDIADVACFSEVATVQVKDIGSVMMKDLQVGQKILTGNGDYQPVYAFGHYKVDEPATFLQLHTSEATLEMTGQHLVFLEDKSNPVRADSVKVGDLLSGSSAVTKISTVNREGINTPFTKDGTLVVDGIVASSYISLQDNAEEFVALGGNPTFISQHDYVHMGLSPFRLMCMGISSSLCSSYDKDGIPYYAAFAIKVNQWAHEQNMFVEAMTLAVVTVLCGICLMLENTLGATWGPTGALVAGAMFLILKATGIRIRATKSKVKTV
jgi:hypothetical protein